MNRSDYFEKGIFIDPMVQLERVKELVDLIRPVGVARDLIRVGGASDGGYLVPDDLRDLESCYSPGVAVTADFEIDLLNKFGIESHLADYSVDSPPESLRYKTFTKKYLGCVNSSEFITLENWVSQNSGPNSGADKILQMDIEGWEYPVIIDTPTVVLQKFRIIILEIHNIDSWFQKDFYIIAKSFFDKLLGDFRVVHSHPNNAGGKFSVHGFELPRLLELTLYRNDRAELLNTFESLPHKLDFPNDSQFPDIKLPAYWY